LAAEKTQQKGQLYSKKKEKKEEARYQVRLT
jgi:hypothetical protein